MELRLFNAVGRNAHHRRDVRRERTGAGDLTAIEQVLQSVAQRRRIPRIVFHLEDDAVVVGRAHRDRAIAVCLGKRRERSLPGFQSSDNGIQARQFTHVAPLAEDAHGSRRSTAKLG